MAGRRIDWEAVRPFYEATPMSRAAIARQFGIHPSTVAKRARKFGWRRYGERIEARAILSERLRLLIEDRVTQLEENKESIATMSSADREKHARELGALMGSYDKVNGTLPLPKLPATETPVVQPKPEVASSGDDDAERWRIELAQRIARLNQSLGD